MSDMQNNFDNNGNKKYRVTKRPGKASGAMSAVVGGIFVLIGIFVVIPSFGAFGILWTLMAAAMVRLRDIFGVREKLCRPRDNDRIRRAGRAAG